MRILEIAGDGYLEDVEQYQPKLEDFANQVLSNLPGHWGAKRAQLWYMCSPRNISLPPQGWKIHISATIVNARDIVTRTADVLASANTAFKFVADLTLLRILNEKGSNRAHSGKFITIYPTESAACEILLARLAETLQSFSGPYILSDRRYKNSETVFFRYGGILPSSQPVDVSGVRPSKIYNPDGEGIEDERVPYFRVPSWMPQADHVNQPAASPIVLNNRYTLVRALHFSNCGGVYLAEDAVRGHQVVIKEARPHTGSFGVTDAVTLLHKEWDVLNDLAPLRLSPQPFDLFQQWEHTYLVQEHISGINLRQFTIAHGIFRQTRPSLQEKRRYVTRVRVIAERLLGMISALHQRGIIFGDLSPTNVLLRDDEDNLCLIDFEAARHTNKPAANMFTPGFARHGRAVGDVTVEDDMFSVGAVALSLLFPLTELSIINPTTNMVLLSIVDKYLQLPTELLHLLESLLSVRHVPSRALSLSDPPRSEKRISDTAEFERSTLQVAQGLVRYICEIGEGRLHRPDYLFYSDAELFSTNPLSLGFGATGCALAIRRVLGSTPVWLDEWLQAQEHTITEHDYPPGLLTGMAGIAYALLDLGHVDRALSLITRAIRHPLKSQDATLYSGLAGIGLVCLTCFLKVRDECFLTAAVQCGIDILAAGRTDERGTFWAGSDGTVKIGMGYGASGISYFLLSLYATTRKSEFLAAAQNAIAFDLSFRARTEDGGFSFPSQAGDSHILYPFLERGTAGIASTCLRFHKVTDDPLYRELLPAFFIDINRMLAVRAGRCRGLAGLGEYMLDAYRFTHEPKCIRAVRRIALGIKPFLAVKRDMYATPGLSLRHVSCSFAHGAAGIALFLQRSLTRADSDLMLDELFL